LAIGKYDVSERPATSIFRVVQEDYVECGSSRPFPENTVTIDKSTRQHIPEDVYVDKLTSLSLLLIAISKTLKKEFQSLKEAKRDP
jgi:hypothetical protein